jgi:hypothetical protein
MSDARHSTDDSPKATNAGRNRFAYFGLDVYQLNVSSATACSAWQSKQPCPTHPPTWLANGGADRLAGRQSRPRRLERFDRATKGDSSREPKRRLRSSGGSGLRCTGRKGGRLGARTIISSIDSRRLACLTHNVFFPARRKVAMPGSGQRRCGTGSASVRDCRASPGGIGSAGRAVGRPPDGQMSDDRRSGSPAGSEGTEHRLRRMSCRSSRSCSASGPINAPALPPAKAPWPLEGRSGCTRGDGHSSCATAKHRPAFSRAFRPRRRDCTSRQVREVSPLALLRIRAPRKCRTAG